MNDFRTSGRDSCPKLIFFFQHNDSISLNRELVTHRQANDARTNDNNISIEIYFQ
jgi:hypothetical protein